MAGSKPRGPLLRSVIEHTQELIPPCFPESCVHLMDRGAAYNLPGYYAIDYLHYKLDRVVLFPPLAFPLLELWQHPVRHLKGLADVAPLPGGTLTRQRVPALALRGGTSHHTSTCSCPSRLRGARTSSWHWLWGSSWWNTPALRCRCSLPKRVRCPGLGAGVLQPRPTACTCSSMRDWWIPAHRLGRGRCKSAAAHRLDRGWHRTPTFGLGRRYQCEGLPWRQVLARPPC